MSTMTTLIIPFTEAVAAFNAVAVHAAGKSEVTQIITGVHVSGDGYLIATDRYTVGRYRLKTDAEGYTAKFDGDEFSGATMPPEAVKFITAMRPAKLAMGPKSAGDYKVRLTFDSSAQDVRVEVGWGDFVTAEQSARFGTLDHTAHRGFPNVALLFPDDSTEFGADRPLSLKMDFLARIGVAVKWLGGIGNGDGCARFRFTKTDNPAKPGPVYIQVGQRFDALVQPNLLVR